LTGYTTRKRLKVASRFADILGDDLIKALPKLIAALADDDPEIGRMCRECIRFSGVGAVSAVPSLKRALYWGPWKDRYDVAATLAVLGAEGEEVLREASKTGDPSISRNAALALRNLERIRKEPTTVPRKQTPVPRHVREEQQRKYRRQTKWTVFFLCVGLLAFCAGVYRFGALVPISAFAAILLTWLFVQIFLIRHRARRYLEARKSAGTNPKQPKATDPQAPELPGQ
jgi:hypothetical protein